MTLRERIIKSIKKNPHRTARETAKCFDGVGVEGIKKILKEEGLELAKRVVEKPEPPRESEHIEELRRQLREKDRDIEMYRRNHGSIVAEVDKMMRSVPRIAPTPSIYKKRRTKVKSPTSITAPISDLHMGANQVANEIEGFGEFSPKICEERLMRHGGKIIDRVTLHSNSFYIPELVVPCMGDLISGDIHDELRITNEWPAPVQAIEAGKLFAKWVASLAPHFERVRVEFVTADNHARLVKKPQAKEEGLNTHNYVVGEYAKKSLERFSNVDFRIHTVYETVISIRQWQYLISHGHNVRGWAGLPLYGWERKLGKEAAARMAIIMQDAKKAKEVGFHQMLFGHWHIPIAMPMYVGCPSISGTDAHDHKEGRHSQPCLSVWNIHEKHGPFDRTDYRL